jgi:multidrug resistance efflux pump
VSATEPEATPTNGRAIPRRLIVITVIAVLVGGGIFGYSELRGAGFVKMDDAAITAPQVDLKANAGGTLTEVYATVGDEVRAHRPIARVGTEVITADVTGTVVSIREDLGAEIAPGTVVASLIDPAELRATGQVDEDAGLSDIHVGQRASVKIDAFPGQDFAGSVEEVSERPHKPQVSFSIADRDQAQQYDVKIKMDNPPAELRPGMSAEIEVQR